MLVFYGGPCWIRTSDHCIKRAIIEYKLLFLKTVLEAHCIISKHSRSYAIMVTEQIRSTQLMSQESVTIENRFHKELLAELDQDEEKTANLREQLKTLLAEALLR